MLKKIDMLGKKVSSKEMKKLKGGLAISAAGVAIGPRCILPGMPCGGGGCTEPDPVCCYGLVCSGSNGIIYNPGFCGGGDSDATA
jgi:hypothetical protein